MSNNGNAIWGKELDEGDVEENDMQNPDLQDDVPQLPTESDEKDERSNTLNAKAYHRAGRAAYDSGNFETARKHFMKALSKR